MSRINPIILNNEEEKLNKYVLINYPNTYNMWIKSQQKEINLFWFICEQFGCQWRDLIVYEYRNSINKGKNYD